MPTRAEIELAKIALLTLRGTFAVLSDPERQRDAIENSQYAGVDLAYVEQVANSTPDDE